MVQKFLASIFGSRNQRLLRKYAKQVARANDIEDSLKGLSDDEMRARTETLRKRFADGESLDDLLPDAFAAVREASVRTLGMRHFDVQLVGGIALHQGKIAEMRTGEGKTLVATLAAYLNALSGGSVHIVTVNDYLAQRDADWMGPIYRFLGMTVGVIKAGLEPAEKRAAYASDIVYGTNNEFGFDYLRDNLAFRADDKAQRELSFAIIDEVDSILIDEARTPLIISGPSEDSTELYEKMNAITPQLRADKFPGAPRNEDIEADKVELRDEKASSGEVMAIGAARARAADLDKDLVLTGEEGEAPVARLVEPADFTADEKSKQVHLSEEGQERVEKILKETGLIGHDDTLYDAANISLMHHLNAALRAQVLYKRDVEYIVKDGEVVIVDEFTGRTMPGRRWSDGLHQAVEAKEGVAVRSENQTLASITFQNYFRMYEKLSGMTGTADTEAYEFQTIYGLEVVVIPTHRPMVRDDRADLVHLTAEDKYKNIIDDIKDCVTRGQPVLVGTTSIETSELLSGVLKKRNISHEVLNAKQHEREAEIVAQAGRPGRVTIATNMAGRGTDIVLGGSLDAELAKVADDDEAKRQTIRSEWEARHAEVLAAGGLHIIGTERHESRRIDNQLRGRSGRQGDPGSSRFYLSMEDSLMRIFGDPERSKALLARVGMKSGEAIESNLLSRQIERAQRKVEAHNFDMRKNLLEYDDVANDQRKVVYLKRNQLMTEDDVSEWVEEDRAETADALIDEYIPRGSVEELWDVAGLSQALEREFGLEADIQAWLDADDSLHEESLRSRIQALLQKAYQDKVEMIGAPTMRHFEKAVMLQQLDMHWKEHLAAMDYLRQGINLRSYAQKNPKQEYKREAFEMFVAMLDRARHDTISILSKVQIRSEEDVEAVEKQRRSARPGEARHAAAPSMTASAPAPRQATEQAQPFVRTERKIGRNEPCPCGSGKKFKQCHGRLK
ncbi:MAG: preprotein translocase subunit SecA [Gammaproteobacteria bacterium]|nr:preprotein translocase subunit SecA [Gammaproteobacteria bacterium]